MIVTMLSLLGGCWQENLPDIDIVGTVVVPRAAATRALPVLDADGNLQYDGDGNVITEDVTDPRLIGPIYLGAFSGVDAVSFDYPHPTMGPIITADAPGDTFPYGGTTVGRIDFACYEFLACKVSTGRFTDYADLLDYFEMIGSPVVDYRGQSVDSASAFQQYCYDYFYVTSDQELSFIGEPMFTENGDRDFEASFYMAHTTYYEGMALWGFMDGPDILATQPENEATYNTCNQSAGRQQYDYDQEFYEGGPFSDILNYPSKYVQPGDWVSEGTLLNAPDENPVIRLSFQNPEE